MDYNLGYNLTCDSVTASRTNSFSNPNHGEQGWNLIRSSLGARNLGAIVDNTFKSSTLVAEVVSNVLLMLAMLNSTFARLLLEILIAVFSWLKYCD